MGVSHLYTHIKRNIKMVPGRCRLESQAGLGQRCNMELSGTAINDFMRAVFYAYSVDLSARIVGKRRVILYEWRGFRNWEDRALTGGYSLRDVERSISRKNSFAEKCWLFSKSFDLTGALLFCVCDCDTTSWDGLEHAITAGRVMRKWEIHVDALGDYFFSSMIAFVSRGKPDAVFYVDGALDDCFVPVMSYDAKSGPQIIKHSDICEYPNVAVAFPASGISCGGACFGTIKEGCMCCDENAIRRVLQRFAESERSTWDPLPTVQKTTRLAVGHMIKIAVVGDTKDVYGLPGVMACRYPWTWFAVRETAASVGVYVLLLSRSARRLPLIHSCPYMQLTNSETENFKQLYFSLEFDKVMNNLYICASGFHGVSYGCKCDRCREPGYHKWRTVPDAFAEVMGLTVADHTVHGDLKIDASCKLAYISNEFVESYLRRGHGNPVSLALARWTRPWTFYGKTHLSNQMIRAIRDRLCQTLEQ